MDTLPDDRTTPLSASNVGGGSASRLVVQVEAANFRLPPPVPKVRSRYRQYVLQRIAPAQLLERDDELRQLAAFCTSQGASSSYRWVRADAWSGKSALMSWFALHPPDKVRVVSFFVTARLANQNDRAAFVDNVMQQLLELVDEELPTLMTDATREAHLMGLIDDAATFCQQRGERLVLLVDGLDEDRGAESHSIAGLLPSSPVAGMRVVVSGRPNPPIPSDVAANHPLRDPSIVMALARSPHADTARVQMERELKALYRGTAVEQDLLGLTTAAGGGLSAADLAELTGKNEWDLGDLLATVVGRSFTRQETERDAIFLLGHEELQVAARGMFGPQRLDSFRDRIHRWADGYRSRRWPLQTPEYLLQGYFNMIAAGGDVARMTECVTDPLRQDRMLDVFGGDALAMDELSTTLAAVAARTPVDLTALTRMAIHRDLLYGRNSNIPADLPVLWAVLGQVNRAESIAYSIQRGLGRARALTKLATIVTGATASARAGGIAAAALDAIQDVQFPDERARLLGQLDSRGRRGRNAVERWIGLMASAIHACCAAGVYDQASRVAKSVLHPAERSMAVSIAVQMLMEEHRLDQARSLEPLDVRGWCRGTKILSLDELPAIRPPTVGELAGRTLTEIREQELGELPGLMEQIFPPEADSPELTALLPGLLERATPSTSVARACIVLGELELAERVLRRLETRSRDRFNVLSHNDVLRNVTRAGVLVGRVDVARAVLAMAQVDEPEGWLVESMAAASEGGRGRGWTTGAVLGALNPDEFRRAVDVARVVPQTESRARALTGLLRHAVDIGDAKFSATLLEWTSALAASARPHERAVDRLLGLADEAVRMNLPGHALTLVRRARDLARAERHSALGHGPLLLDVANGAANIGELDLAERLFFEAEHTFRQTWCSIDAARSLALLAHRIGNAAAAAMWLDCARRSANTVTDEHDRACRLAQIARTACDTGEVAIAGQLVLEAEEAVRALQKPVDVLREGSDPVLAAIADAAVGLGDLDRARGALAKIGADRERREALLSIMRSTDAAAGRHALAQLLLMASWSSVIDHLVCCDESILDAVVAELLVVVRSSDHHVPEESAS